MRKRPRGSCRNVLDARAYVVVALYDIGSDGIAELIELQIALVLVHFEFRVKNLDCQCRDGDIEHCHGGT